jgi:glycine/D-amino acid oxidase-like deaminating enzyme
LYQNLALDLDLLQYAEIRTRHIVFSEGLGVRKNPYFSYLPLKGTKGEVLTISAPELKLNAAIKSSVFIIPIGKDLYNVGSTYNWEDKTNTPTRQAREELLTKLETFITCDFDVVEHLAGIRPTAKDRRPLVGRHPEHQNLYVLNGLGSRGVMIAPYVAEQLYNYIENDIPLSSEININRLTS